MDKKVAVIGRGFGGLNVALELVSNGCSVEVFGSKELNCASNAAIGVCTVKGIFEADSELFRRKIEGHKELFHQLKWLSKKSDNVKFASGVTEVFSSKEHYQRQLRRIFRSDFYGLKGVDPSKLNGYLGQTQLVTYPFDFGVDVDSYRDTLELVLNSLGAKIHNKLIDKIVEFQSGVVLQLKNDTLSKQFDFVVCVAGIGAKSIGGINQDIFNGVSLVKGWSFFSAVKEKYLVERCEEKAFVSGTHGLYISKDKVACYGSTSEPSVDWNVDADNGLSESLVSLSFEQGQIRSQFDSLYEFQKKQESSRSGVRIRSRNRMPQLRWNSSSRRTLMVYGFYKNGLTLAPITAKEVYLELIQTGNKS